MIYSDGKWNHTEEEKIKIAKANVGREKSLETRNKISENGKLFYSSLDNRKKTSEKRKEYLKNNPDKHPWRSNNKFKSVPCEKLKQKLLDAEISFVAEFQPLLPDRFFAIDISFPDKKIGIEINGNQHYNSDGTLKPYYQERKDLLVGAGWTIYEYHYSFMYNEVFLIELIKKLKENHSLGEMDYSFYIKEKNADKICSCGKKIWKDSSSCRSCSNKKSGLKRLQFNISKQELEKLIKVHPFTTIGKMFSVSDNAIKKRAISFGIDIKQLSPFSHRK